MKIIRFVVSMLLLSLCIGVSPINTAMTQFSSPAVYAQDAGGKGDNADEAKSGADQKRIKLPSFKDMFKFGKPKPDNLKKATGRNLFIIGLVLTAILHQVLPFLFFAIGGTRLSGARISIIASIFFFLLMTLWAIGVMMTTGQVIAWGIILLLIFVIWAALSRR